MRQKDEAQEKETKSGHRVKRTRSSRTATAFSRLKRERDKPTRRRSPLSATMFTRLGPRDKDVFTRLGERKKSVHSRLGLDVTPRHRHASRKRSTNRPRTRDEERYYSENDHDQGGHWKSKKHRSSYEDDLSQPWLYEETDPFT
ncbi:hypothetical protein Tco_0136865, partial [Tanacetum coccineum]